jgi:hypothetical protein
MAAQPRVVRTLLTLPRSRGGAPRVDSDRSAASGVRGSAGRLWPALLLIATSQITDLVTFNMAVQRFGPQGELGPLGIVYRAAGIGAVAFVKLGLIGVVMTVLARYPWQRYSTRRRLAIIVAAIGVFGALTNVAAFIWLA